MSADLKSRKLIVTKGLLFLLAALTSIGLLVHESPRWQTVVLILTAIWSCCRFYYFLFHVLERWVNPGLRWRGLTHLLMHLIRTDSRPAAAAHEKTAGDSEESPAVM